MTDKSLKKIIFLNTLTGWIDKIVSILVNFIIRPFIIHGLGVSMFGVWEMLNKMTDLMASADFRAATTVKWFLSINREKESYWELNRKISAGFIASLCIIPLYLLIGSIIVYYSPLVTKVDSSYYLMVRIASSILLLSFVVTQVFFIYEQILQGMNMAYKRIGARAFITILGGGLTYFVLKNAWGIPGLVGVNLFVVVTTGITFWLVVRENLNWVRIHIVPWREVLSFIKISFLFMIDKFLSIIHKSIDVLLLGYLLSSSIVAAYTISSYVIISLIGFINMIVASIITGVTPMVKENDVRKLLSSRSYILLIIIAIYSISASFILLFNDSFIHLWTKEELFLGQLNNLLILVFLFIRTLADIDKSFLCMYLKVKIVNINSFVSLMVMVILTFILIKGFGVTGMLIGLILSQLLFMFLNAYSLRKIVNIPLMSFVHIPYRMVIALLFVWIISYRIGNLLKVDSWLELCICMLLTLMLIIAYVLFVGLGKQQRAEVLKRIIVFKR